MKLTVIKIDPFKKKLFVQNINAPAHEVLYTNEGSVTQHGFQLEREAYPTHALFVDNDATYGGYSFASDPTTIHYGFGMVTGVESKKKKLIPSNVRFSVDEVQNEIKWH